MEYCILLASMQTKGTVVMVQKALGWKKEIFSTEVMILLKHEMVWKSEPLQVYMYVPERDA